MVKHTFDESKAFFVFDSDHLEEVDSKLYGFTIIQNELITDAAFLPDELSPGGAFVFVKRTENGITVRQDFMGSYGLYLYRDGAYFALSNSFQRLVDYLKPSKVLTVNTDYADYFVNAELCSVAFSETLIKEIRCLDRCAEVNIDISRKELEISLHDYGENTVELSSPEGMRVLDEWYHKWTQFIRNLCASGAQIQTDLSGGFDSRMTFTLLLGSGIDMNKVFVHSLNDGLHVHDEDFRIATAISDHYHFSLNNNSFLDGSSWLYPLKDILNISFYLKLGFHKQMYYRRNCLKVPRNAFSGSGGECLRSYWKMSQEEYIEKAVSRYRSFPDAAAHQMEASARRILERSFEEIRNKFASFGRELAPEDMTLYLYRETRCRNHFGKDVVENHFSNFMKHTPLLDPLIHRIKLSDSQCSDHNLLAAVILSRYNPALLDFPFEGGRSIAESTKQYARLLNQMYPYAPEQVDAVKITPYSAIWNYQDENAVPALDGNAIENAVKTILASPSVWGSFCGRYGTKVYQSLCDDIRTRKYQPLQNAYGIIGIGKAIQDAAFSKKAVGMDVATGLLCDTDCCSMRDYQEHSAVNPSAPQGKSLFRRGLRFLKRRMKSILKRIMR